MARNRRDPGVRGYWLLTPIGVVRLHPETGAIHHFGLSFKERQSDLLTLHVEGENLLIVDRARGLWREKHPGRWLLDFDDETVQRLGMQVRNDLMVWERKDVGDYEIRLPHVPVHRFHNRPSLTPLIQNGVFLFDDVRDMRYFDGRLLVATRVGIWEYPLDRVRRLVEKGSTEGSRLDARIPVRADLTVAVQPGLAASDPPATFLLPDRFVMDTRHPTVQLVSASPGQVYERQHPASWRVRARDTGPSERAIELPGGGRLGHLSLEEKQLWVNLQPRDSSSRGRAASIPLASESDIRLEEAIETQHSIWVSFTRGILWIRKQRLLHD